MKCSANRHTLSAAELATQATAQPTEQRLRQREKPTAVRWFVFADRSGLGGQTRLQDADRLVQTAGPQLDSTTAGQHPHADVRMPAQLPGWDLADQQLRAGCLSGFLQPSRFLSEVGGDLEGSLDERALAVVPDRVIGERRGWRREFGEADAAWQLFG